MGYLYGQFTDDDTKVSRTGLRDNPIRVSLSVFYVSAAADACTTRVPTDRWTYIRPAFLGNVVQAFRFFKHKVVGGV